MLMTKEQIAAQRAQMEQQLKFLQEQESNYEKKAEGFKKLQELEEKFKENRAKLAKQYFITDEEMEVLNAPKFVFAIPYKDSLGQSKVYEWRKGKIGKAPNEVEDLKAHGMEALSKYLTEFGKEYAETEEGKMAIKQWLTPKPKKVKAVATA